MADNLITNIKPGGNRTIQQSIMATLIVRFLEKKMVQGQSFPEMSTVKTVTFTQAKKMSKAWHKKCGFENQIVYLCKKSKNNPYGAAYVIKDVDGSRCETCQLDSKNNDRLEPSLFSYSVCTIL